MDMWNRKISPPRIRRMAKACLSIAVGGLIVLGVGSAFDRYEALPYPGEPPQSELVAGLRYAMVATGKPMPEHVDDFHRGRATGLSSVADMSASFEDSQGDIERHMAQAGWRLVESRKGNQGTEYLKFCNNGVAAIFDSRDSFSPNRVFVRTVWAESPKHEGYCVRSTSFKTSLDPIKDGQG